PLIGNKIASHRVGKALFGVRDIPAAVRTVPGGRVFINLLLKVKEMKKRYWIEIISALFILLFVYTAVNKIIDHARFQNVLRGSILLSHYAPFVSRAIPIIEICISLLLFFPRSKRIGLWFSLILMTLFT